MMAKTGLIEEGKEEDIQQGADQETASSTGVIRLVKVE